jgi:hypothetical protein
MTSEDVLNKMKTILGHPRTWEKEVRFNWVFEFGRTLFFFARPRNIFELNASPGAQYLMPQGIIAITKTLLNQHMSDEAKIKGIKELLLNKGYDGTHEGSSWKRTIKTNNTYKQLAELIADYEHKQQSIMNFR